MFLKTYLSTLFVLITPCFALAQSPKSPIIKIENGSFESILTKYYSNPYVGDFRKTAKTNIPYWISCGFKETTPFDIQPGSFECTTAPFDGYNYVGLVTRVDNTFEWASQKLSKPLLKGQTYMITVYTARSDIYRSVTNESINKRIGYGMPEEHNFNTPCRLALAASNDECAKSIYIADPVFVQNTIWQKVTFRFKPTQVYTYLHLFANYHFKEPTESNILLDNISDILPIDSITGMPTIYIPTMDTTEIKDRAGAELVIEKNLKYFFLEQHSYNIPKEWFYQYKKPHFGNKELTTLVRAFSKIPNSKLIICLKKEAFDDIIAWKTILYRYFENNFKLDKTKISIEKYKKEDKKRKLVAETPQFSIFIE